MRDTAHKQLSAMRAIIDPTAYELEDYEERAAILEYCAGYSRAEAERLAKEIINGQRADE